MALSLSTYRGDFRALKALIAARYNEVEIKQVDLELNKDNLKPEFLAKNPTGKVPMLETPHGVLFESNAIARYVARIRRDTELYGRTFFESSQVDAWLDFVSHDVEVPATLWFFPVLGFSDFHASVHEEAVANLFKALAVLERHLLSRTYLVGEAVTLADIVAAVTLLYPFKLLFDAPIREAFPSVTRWFFTCVNQPAFAAVVGEVPVCEKQMTAGGASTVAAPAGAAKAATGGAGAASGGKKEKAAAAKKEEKPKPAAAAPAPAAPKPAAAAAAADDAEAAPKKANPFASLPKSKLDLEEWKRVYSNSRSDYYKSMPWFWEHFDKEGYSLWLCKYKYNDECTRDYATSNLISGFIQRSEEMRRFSFSIMHALKESAPFEVEGLWCIRGTDIKPLLEANDDAEHFVWTKLDADSEADRTMVGDYWCAPETLRGLPIMDSKVFK